MGGENETLTLRVGEREGSSPRGRGKHVIRPGGNRLAGLIPAWAGKTAPSRASADRSWAHPRVGGENVWVWVPVAGRAGSSPRGRGKPGKAPPQSAGPRLIPAWAGKTLVVRLSRVVVAAHPRVGGENAKRTPIGESPLGSSPRGRGKRCECGCALGCGRLIPAWAGKTSAVGGSLGLASAHPRVGGENQRPGYSL